jgi:catechol 2,3-dioxygenase-like lactoylglutathione lyase family enzyme
MTVELNHTIVPARDPQASARFLAEILGLSVDPPVAHFTPVTLANQVSLDYDRMDGFEPHHYAFMVGEEEFDAVLARIQQGGITHYGDPACREIGQVYQSKNVAGRRGTYFHDPDGHLMEILTRGVAGS